MDFRGRIYPEISLISYQGIDLIRSLIYFSESETINDSGIDYLKIYLANVFIGSSSSYNERLQ